MGFSIEHAEICPGTLGLLIDETPQLTTADIKPFVWAILLYRGAVAPFEVVAAVTPLCGTEDLKSGFEGQDDDDDRTRLEWLVDEVLGDMTAAGLLRYNESKDIWTLQLGENHRHLPTVIKVVAGTDGSLPDHLRLHL